MNSPDPAAARLHLRAAAIALTLVALAGVVAFLRARYLERKYIRAVVAEGCEVKDFGIVWQRECLAQPDFLPMYGSSELNKRAPNKASIFFESYPSGFAVSPVGRASCTSLILLEKIAAAGSQAPGRKVVICISPSWFTVRGANSVGFAGNFSNMQAMELFYGSPLSLRLKSSIAVQMLRYPQVLQKNPLLAVAVKGLGGDSFVDMFVYFAAMPLGWLRNGVYRLQDHFEVIQWMRGDHKLFHLVPRQTVALDWDRLIADSKSMVKPLAEEVADSRFSYFSDDEAFAEVLGKSYEWGDLKLLVRTAQELNLELLLLSMPMEDAHFKRMGISPLYRAMYSEKLHIFADMCGVPAADFYEHGVDPEFFADHYGHPSAKGWAYFNRAVDDFFHDRPLNERDSSPPDIQALSKMPTPGASRSQ